MTFVPQHIAIVMDGNGRWAKKRFLPRVAGHKQGLESLKRCIKACVKEQVKVLTVFAFSSENWDRPPEEVSALLDLLLRGLNREMNDLHDAGVKVCFLGDRLALSTTLQEGLAQAENRTSNNQTLTLNVCFNYGGRWDIVNAAQQALAKGQAITLESLQENMATAHCGDPDLVIRTGGEMRISNFLLWQSAYSEFVFSAKLWPEFDETDLSLAIKDFNSRERRFGKTGDQVQSSSSS
jgi:undecaprenyl diphosphate synthase